MSPESPPRRAGVGISERPEDGGRHPRPQRPAGGPLGARRARGGPVPSAGVPNSPDTAARWVLLDIGGVLIRWRDEELFARVSRRFRRPVAEVSRVLRRNRKLLQSGQIDLRSFWSRTARALGAVVPSDYRSLWASGLATRARFRTELRPLLRDLSRAGVRVGVFSNTDRSHWRILRSRGWLRGMSPLLPSFRLGTVKPDPVAYRRAEERFRPEWGRPIFVDDSPANVRGAHRAGWDAVQFTTVPALRRELARRWIGRRTELTAPRATSERPAHRGRV